jgi:hypothetical protein
MKFIGLFPNLNIVSNIQCQILQSSKRLWKLFIHLHVATIDIKQSFKNDKYRNLRNINYLLMKT